LALEINNSSFYHTVHFRSTEQQFFLFYCSGAFLLGKSGYAKKGQILTILFRIKLIFLGYRCPQTQLNLASGLAQL